MAEINLGSKSSKSQSSTATEVMNDGIPASTEAENTSAGIGYAETDRGLTADEQNDPNKIKVTIADKETPMVVFFGPPACGKTMTLIRLTRYLREKGYTIEPVSSFRPSYDENYRDMCNQFDHMIGDSNAAESTSRISFMLVRVLKKGKPLCQILEAPGEHYFNPEDPKAQFPRYVNNIINSGNRKIWAIMLEPDSTSKSMDEEERSHYVNRIHKFKSKMRPTDKVMFVYNKVDETSYVIAPGRINYGGVMKNAKDLYQGIFTPFMNENPITKFLKTYNFDFLAFQTGDFCEANDGTLTFEQGPDEYPKKMWEIILKRIKG